MRAHLYMLAGLMIAGAGLACDTSDDDADPRLAYCFKFGDIDCVEDNPGPQGEVCGYRTESQDSWGAACKGNDAGCFRDENFSDVFPEGLYVGCGEYTANLLSADAVESALMTSGTPRPLLKEEAVAYDGDGDPVVGTGLFGEIVGLSLNVRFDTLDGFAPGNSPGGLAGLVLAEGPCTGMTVAQVLDEANYVLGGCPAALTPADAAACVTMINSSFLPQPGNCAKEEGKQKDNECDADPPPSCSDLYESP